MYDLHDAIVIGAGQDAVFARPLLGACPACPSLETPTTIRSATRLCHEHAGGFRLAREFRAANSA
jgi:hypothetical protein